MNLGVVFAIFGMLLALAIVLPGLILTWALLLPTLVERARGAIEGSPWRCLISGAVLAVLATPVLAVLLSGPGPFQLLGWVGLGGVLALATLGGAGVTALMGYRLSRTALPTLTPGGLLRSAIALELAMMTPLVGWFVLLPILFLLGLGAAGLALIRPLRRRVAPVATEVAHGPQPS
ncbi:MAG: hypothetical protein HC822_16025 [Oscillochloris sp.]|nr:hypothetical protein [Oscillochloris sp.]